METTPTAAPEAPDAELVEFLGGAVESKAPPAEPAAPAPAAQPDGSEGAQPRDATGKFTTAEPSAAVPEPPAPAAETPPDAPPEPVLSKSFSYRAYGADHNPFTGAVETPEGGVQFPPDAVAHLRQVLAEGHNAESRRRQAERAQESKLTSARATNAAIVRKSEIALQRLADLRRDPEAFQAWFQDLDRNWAIYEAEIERDTLRAELESQRAALAEQQLTQQAEALRPQMRQTLEQQVGRMIAGEADLQGLDALQAVERLWGTFFDRVFVEAAQDDPHGRYRRGEILIDYDAIRAELQYEAKVRGAGKTPPPPVAAPVPPKPPVTPPPVVSSKGAGGRPTPKVPKFKTTEDADRWFDEGGYNEL